MARFSTAGPGSAAGTSAIDFPISIIDQQDELKSWPDKRLTAEMQKPTDAAPPYLVFSEVSRRKNVRDRHQNAQKKAGPKTSMAQEAIASAIGAPGPQGGIAQAMGPGGGMPQGGPQGPPGPPMGGPGGPPGMQGPPMGANRGGLVRGYHEGGGVGHHHPVPVPKQFQSGSSMIIGDRVVPYGTGTFGTGPPLDQAKVEEYRTELDQLEETLARYDSPSVASKYSVGHLGFESTNPIDILSNVVGMPLAARRPGYVPPREREVLLERKRFLTGMLDPEKGIATTYRGLGTSLRDLKEKDETASNLLQSQYPDLLKTDDQGTEIPVADVAVSEPIIPVGNRPMERAEPAYDVVNQGYGYVDPLTDLSADPVNDSFDQSLMDMFANRATQEVDTSDIDRLRESLQETFGGPTEAEKRRDIYLSAAQGFLGKESWQEGAGSALENVNAVMRRHRVGGQARKRSQLLADVTLSNMENAREQRVSQSNDAWKLAEANARARHGDITTQTRSLESRATADRLSRRDVAEIKARSSEFIYGSAEDRKSMPLDRQINTIDSLIKSNREVLRLMQIGSYPAGEGEIKEINQLISSLQVQLSNLTKEMSGPAVRKP